MFIAASAIAVVASGGNAQALTPLSIDPSGASERSPDRSAEPSRYAATSPSGFTAPEIIYEPRPSLNRRARLQCVPFARREAGVEIYGDAGTWWGQAQGRFEIDYDPSDGAVIVMRGYADANRGHVGVVREVISDRVILVDHANWLNKGEITRAVPVRDVSPRGDWSAIQVWHVPGGHWGGRTYQVRGFIPPGETGDMRMADSGQAAHAAS
jgi:surface antigen